MKDTTDNLHMKIIPYTRGKSSPQRPLCYKTNYTMYTKRPLGGGSTRSPLSTSEGGSSSSNRRLGFLMDALVTVAAGVWGSLPSHSYSFKSVSGRMSHLTYECLLLKYIKCKNVFSEFMKNGLLLFQHTHM